MSVASDDGREPTGQGASGSARAHADGAAWRSHEAGRLVLHVRPYSPAARDVDEFANRYAEALRSVSNALDIDADALPAIAVNLSDLPSAEPSVSPSVQHEAILGDRSRPGEITIWTAYGNESPSSRSNRANCSGIRAS